MEQTWYFEMRGKVVHHDISLKCFNSELLFVLFIVGPLFMID